MPIEYDQLEKNAGNFVPLTPLSFLQRTADVIRKERHLFTMIDVILGQKHAGAVRNWPRVLQKGE